MSESCHVSVLTAEVLAGLDLHPGQVVVDGTLGGGGHARALAECVGPTGRVLAFDRDLQAVERATRELSSLPVTPIHASYEELETWLAAEGQPRVDGLVLDLGLSSDQLADRARGFSFDAEGPLDLRFDATQGETAAELIRRLRADDLADVIYRYGEERLSRRIARAIVEARQVAPIDTAARLAEVVRRATPRGRPGKPRIDPATRTFQALRIAVNDELGALARALDGFPRCLKPGARVAIISFHSLEDRTVKQALRDDPRWTPITKKPLVPTAEEIDRNPRSRSAKLRIARRSDAPDDARRASS